MNWYRVTREDGSYSWVQATSKSEASQKVRNPGELIKLVKEVNESDVPASAKGGTAEPTPTPTPTPTTPTPTTPPVGGTTPTPYTSEGSAMLQYIQNKIAQGLPLTNPEKAYLTTNLTKSGQATGGISQEWIDNYEQYLAEKGSNFPTPKDIYDYMLHYEEWQGNSAYYQAGYTQDQIDNYDRFSAFASQYGDLNDYRPTDLADYLANYDKAQGQLDTWVQEAGPEATGFTDNQVREYYAFKEYQSAYGEPGEWKPVDIGDFFTNYNTAQQQLDVWKQQAGEVEKYELEPGEAARRREEAYAEGRYAAKERYGEPPEYQPAFAQWMGGQEQFSGALQQYVEREYPSLKSEFQATQPTLTGFPTREEARTEKARREQAFQAWLPKQIPGLEQEYWSQRPAERGERLYMQAPAMVAKNW